MKRFIIEREIPGASDLTPAQRADIARASNEVVAGLDVPYTWVNSYVAGDKIYCVHETDNVETILEHARRGRGRRCGPWPTGSPLWPAATRLAAPSCSRGGPVRYPDPDPRPYPR